ncbi:MAG: hypothetical protein V4465_00835 [Patescibacteria group bacterium]
MKAVLFGTNKEAVRTLAEEAGFTIVENDPECVISYGGDGTLMRSESAYPKVLKVLLRDSSICKKCSAFSNEEVLKKVISGSYTTEKLWKLEARVGDKILRAVNDVIVHNQNPRHGIRYTLKIQGKPFGKVIIGDGIVVATPFGSTAYYRSITDSYFEVGIGLAFNNSTEQADHIVLKDDSVIELEVSRGPAVVFADNDPEELILQDGDQVLIKRSEEYTEIVCPL